MEKLDNANKRLKTAREDHEKEYEEQIAKLNSFEHDVKERVSHLSKKKLETAKANGNEDAADEDLVEINAGGKTIAAKRFTLTQIKGSRLEALFSGRWDKKLPRDSNGRIFLDANPVCFQAIVDYLNELAISSEDNPPAPPSVDDEYDHILRHQLELLGLQKFEIPDSKIIKAEQHVIKLHDWLKEDDSDGNLRLLHRGSRDGMEDAAFHSKCDNKGCTVVIIQTNDGQVVGGYSNTPWRSDYSGRWSKATKAFLFALSGCENSSPFKMKLKNAKDGQAVHLSASYGPYFGRGTDLYVQGTYIYSNQSSNGSYERPSSFYIPSGHIIQEIEVFQVIPSTLKLLSYVGEPSKVRKIEDFSEKINSAINAKWAALEEAQAEHIHLEDSFKDEGTFISFFASGQNQDVVTLNVCGTMMTTRLPTLLLCKHTALASKFASHNNESNCKAIKEWTNEEVVAWLNKLEGISNAVVKEFDENQVNGRELLALGVEGMKDFGVTRKGTIYLLLDEIKKLEKAGSDSVTLIEHSPYCFEKILDHLRMEATFMKGLVKTKHGLPIVREGERGRFKKVVNHLFPGNNSLFFQDS